MEPAETPNCDCDAPPRVECPHKDVGRKAPCVWRVVQADGYEYLVCADCGGSVRPDSDEGRETTPYRDGHADLCGLCGESLLRPQPRCPAYKGHAEPGRETTPRAASVSPRPVRPAAPGDPLPEVPGYHHADDGTLCRTAARTGPADPVCSCPPGARTRDLRFYEDDVERVEVGSGVAIALWPDGRIGFEHVCPGIWQDPDEPPVETLIAPFWPGQIVHREPLTLTPSLLCQGAANPCGLHGFVTDGVWRGC